MQSYSSARQIGRSFSALSECAAKEQGCMISHVAKVARL